MIWKPKPSCCMAQYAGKVDRCSHMEVCHSETEHHFSQKLVPEEISERS